MRVIAVLLASFWLFGCGPSAEGPTSVTDSGAPDTALNVDFALAEGLTKFHSARC